MVKNFVLAFLSLALLSTVLAVNWQDGNNGKVKWAMDCDFYGSDIGNQGGTGDLCGGFCLANSQCTHFTWSNNVCYMKRISNPNVQPTYLKSAVCGYVVNVIQVQKYYFVKLYHFYMLTLAFYFMPTEQPRS